MIPPVTVGPFLVPHDTMSRLASCPACAAPVSSRAVMCALCDHVLDAPRMAAATRAADRRSSRSTSALRSWADVLRPIAWLAGIIGGLVAVTAMAFSAGVEGHNLWSRRRKARGSAVPTGE